MKVNFCAFIYLVIIFISNSYAQTISFNRTGKQGMKLNDIKIADYKDSLTSFSIGLLDSNKDGKFTFDDNDSIYIDFYGTELFIWEASKSRSNLKNNLIVESGKYQYKMELKDEELVELKISKCTTNQISDLLRLNRLTDFQFITINDSIQSINEFLNQGKYIFIDIWSVFCSPCLKSFPLLNEIHSKYSDKLTIITLLDRGDKNDLIRISDQFKIQFIQGFSSDDINRELRLNGYPTGLLFDEKGNLVQYNIRAKELLEVIK